MPCKLSSQVRTCLFICDSLLSPINKSKTGNYLEKIALKQSLLGHQQKHQHSRTPVKLCIMTFWRTWPGVAPHQPIRRRRAALTHCWPHSDAFRMLSTTDSPALALQRADVSSKPAQSASFHPHTSLQSEGKALDVQRLVGGPAVTAPPSKRFRKRTAKESPVLWVAAEGSGQEESQFELDSSFKTSTSLNS